MDLDPRDYDDTCDRHRNEERDEIEPSRGRRGSSSTYDRDDHGGQPDLRPRDRDDDDARTLGRGPSNERQSSDDHGRSAAIMHVGRSGIATPASDIATSTTRSLGISTLPPGLERKLVRDRDHVYTLRGSKTQTLSTVGAFRVSPVVTSETMTAAQPIRTRVIFGTYVNKG